MRISDWSSDVCSSDLTPDTHVVLYGDNNNWFAAYALWLMELYGHTNVSLMDGGRVKWLRQPPDDCLRAGDRSRLVRGAGPQHGDPRQARRSEERRGGKECVSKGKSRGVP